MSDFTLLRLLPCTALPGEDTPVWVQHSDGGPVERTTLAGFAEQADSARPIRLVLSSADVVMTEVTLSRKQARHLQKVLPYLLEETLLGDPESFWFSWGEPGKAGKDEGRWPVLAVKREFLASLRDFFAHRGLSLRSASSDGALLGGRAPLRLSDSAGVLLMADSHRALPVDAESEQTIINALELNDVEWEHIDGDAAAFQAFREAYRAHEPIELLHNGMRPARQQKEAVIALGPWRPFAVLAAAVVVSASVLLGIQHWRYSKAAEASHQGAIAAYQQLFPGDRASSGLRRQFQARLNRLGGGASTGGGFLALMAPVGQVLGDFREKGVDSQRLRYDARQTLLTVDLQAKDFDVLEQIRSAINSQGLKAEIATARNEGSGVKARLKVERS